MDNSEKKLLWVSLWVPFDRVDHAGGKIENFYIKAIKKQGYDVRLVSYGIERERNKVDLDEYGIENEVKYYPDNYSRILRMMDILKQTIRTLKRYKKENYNPDVIILQWTQISLLMDRVKRIFPSAKIIMVEEDVTFLAYQRNYKFQKNIIKRWVFWNLYWIMKKKELHLVRTSDYTICNNAKDCKLLYDNGIPEDKVGHWVPYYQNIGRVNYEGNNRNILFYGAMARKENYLSALWFIDNVMPLISDLDITFQIVGGNPNEMLKSRESEKVKILGFVDDLHDTFEQALCLVAPLLLGAGIKIKILEGMATGVPVLTNDIGIEGIYANDGSEYIYAVTPEDYAAGIRKLYCDENYGKMISHNSIEFMYREFDLDKSKKWAFDTIDRVISQ